MLVHSRVSRFPRRRLFRRTTCQNSEREQHWQHQNVLFPVRLNHKASKHRLFQILARALRHLPDGILPGLFSSEYMKMFKERSEVSRVGGEMLRPDATNSRLASK